MKKPELKDLTLREKIGQMFIMRDDRLHDMISNDELEAYLKEHPLGGIWATGRLKSPAAYLNFDSSGGKGTLSDLKDYTELLNKYSKIPLLIGGDSEKGGFMGATDIAGPDAAVATNDDELFYLYGAAEADELKCGGLNWRWSPISDMCHHDASISVNRVCSDDPEKIIRYSKGVIKGSQDRGVAATVKHFPGHDINEIRDPHFMTSVNNMSFDDWMKVQGRIYKEVIECGAYSVMIGHHAFPAIDDSMIGTKRRPATFSKKIITDLLKNEWGFDGVVVTDDISMRAAFSVYGRQNMFDMYIELINAGNDMLLGTSIGVEHEEYIIAIEKAVKNGKISEDRINDACVRILNMKERLGLFEDVNKPCLSIEEAAANTMEMNRRVAEKSLTLLSNKLNLLPCKNIKKVSIIAVTHSEVFVEKLDALKKAFEGRGIEVILYNNVNECNLRLAAERDDIIIYANFVSAHNPMGHCTFFGDVAQQFFKIMTFGGEKSVVVSFGSPFIKYEYYEEADTYINAYWYNKETMEALVEGILGEIRFLGESPFEI